jgi:hypothetical protein
MEEQPESVLNKNPVFVLRTAQDPVRATEVQLQTEARWKGISAGYQVGAIGKVIVRSSRAAAPLTLSPEVPVVTIPGHLTLFSRA